MKKNLWCHSATFQKEGDLLLQDKCFTWNRILIKKGKEQRPVMWQLTFWKVTTEKGAGGIEGEKAI